MPESSTYLPAEWHEQSAVQLTWPHSNTDWQPILEDVTRCYIDMAKAIASRERLIIVAPNPEEVEHLLANNLSDESMQRISFCKAPTNDTWARDHGFITLLSPNGPRLLDFKFNGWGEKFAADLDNCICRRMAEQNIFKGDYEDHLDFVLEGGSIESDGKGTILTTSHCLLAPHRNQPLSQAQIEARLLDALHAKRILWLDHGYLAGDDTDSHIDTLARICPNDTIVFVGCRDIDDEHFEALLNMRMQLESFTTADGRPYRLLELPMADAMYDEDGERLPATYANYLVLNDRILLPTYNQPDNDRAATEIMRLAYPGYQIVGIDCSALVRQHGSLHCSTMQIPQGLLYL